MDDYFANDEYWKEHIDKELEEDMWIDEYKKYFKNNGVCLDLGCGIGQFTKKFMEYGYSVISADISKTALNKVKEFNKNIANIDMTKPLPFDDDKLDLVFANLSIHYFSNLETKKLVHEIYRILKSGGLFIGSVNSIKAYEKVKSKAKEIGYHYYFINSKHIRLFDEEDLRNYLNMFKVLKIEERKTTRFEHEKDYIIFIAKKK